jgi:hypothetical protein
VAVEEFGILILANLGSYYLEVLFIVIYIGIAIILLPVLVLMSVGVCWTGGCDV